MKSCVERMVWLIEWKMKGPACDDRPGGVVRGTGPHQPLQGVCAEQHLDQVPCRLPDRPAEGDQRIVVREEVAQEGARPEAQPAEREERDRYAGRKPDDPGD